MWFASLLAIIEAALEIWAYKEKRKYIDEVLAIKTTYYQEQNKPKEIRSDAVLDHCEFRLRLLATAMSVDMKLHV